MRARPVGLALWLLVLAAAQVAGLIAVWRFSVRSRHGQLLDTFALSGNRIGRADLAHLVDGILNGVSVLWLLVAAAIVGFIALVRRRIAVGAGAAVLVVGANLTALVLKHVISRPYLGVDPQRAAAGNSLPSGHTAVVASVALALVLVLPPKLRGTGAVLGAAATALVGVATLSAGWHRPGDAVAALLVVGAWACVAGLVILAAQRGYGGVGYGKPHRIAVAALVVAGMLLLAGTRMAVAVTDPALAVPIGDLSRNRLLVAYAGGAAAIAGTAAWLFALVLFTAHRVVPATRPPVAVRAEPVPVG